MRKETNSHTCAMECRRPRVCSSRSSSSSPALPNTCRAIAVPKIQVSHVFSLPPSLSLSLPPPLSPSPALARARSLSRHSERTSKAMGRSQACTHESLSLGSTNCFFYVRLHMSSYVCPYSSMRPYMCPHSFTCPPSYVCPYMCPYMCPAPAVPTQEWQRHC